MTSITEQESSSTLPQQLTEAQSQDEDVHTESPPSQRPSLPSTDSMVTVRLSNSPSVSQSNTSTPRNSISDSIRKSLRFSFHSPTHGRSDSAAIDEVAVGEMTENEEGIEPASTVVERTLSTTSMGSIQDRTSTASALSSQRSRSDSSGTLSSNGSAQVDWDELERSEEQAPKDQGSDEVRNNLSSMPSFY